MVATGSLLLLSGTAGSARGCCLSWQALSFFFPCIFWGCWGGVRKGLIPPPLTLTRTGPSSCLFFVPHTKQPHAESNLCLIFVSTNNRNAAASKQATHLRLNPDVLPSTHPRTSVPGHITGHHPSPRHTPIQYAYFDRRPHLGAARRRRMGPCHHHRDHPRRRALCPLLQGRQARPHGRLDY